MNIMDMVNEAGQGVYKHIKSVVDASRLVEGVDFEVASMTVMNHEFEMFSLDNFLRMKSTELFRKYNYHNHFLETTRSMLETLKVKQKVLALDQTPFPSQVNDNFVFYRLYEEIDFGLAISLGLGVVKYENEFMLYCPFYGQIKGWDDMDEVIMLKMYFQLKYPDEYDRKLESLVHKHREIVETLIISNPNMYINRMKQIFQSHK